MLGFTFVRDLLLIIEVSARRYKESGVKEDNFKKLKDKLPFTITFKYTFIYGFLYFSFIVTNII